MRPIRHAILSKAPRAMTSWRKVSQYFKRQPIHGKNNQIDRAARFLCQISRPNETFLKTTEEQLNKHFTQKKRNIAEYVNNTPPNFELSYDLSDL